MLSTELIDHHLTATKRAVLDQPQIGPNVVLQLIPAAIGMGFGERLKAIFKTARFEEWWSSPPHEMIAAKDASILFGAIHNAFSSKEAEALLARAGQMTADYLLANRIPKPAQFILRFMPRRLAVQILSKAIAKHAWTFAGAGRFKARITPSIHFEITDNPLCANLQTATPSCHWHAAVFQRIFGSIFNAPVRVTEIECAGVSGRVCRFEIIF